MAVRRPKPTRGVEEAEGTATAEQGRCAFVQANAYLSGDALLGAIEKGSDIVEDRVVVQRNRLRQGVGAEVEVVVAGERPPVVERRRVVGTVAGVVQPQTEAGASQSVGPDLGVLAVHALRHPAPLVREMAGDGGMRPGERVVAVADHLHGLGEGHQTRHASGFLKA